MKYITELVEKDYIDLNEYCNQEGDTFLRVDVLEVEIVKLKAKYPNREILLSFERWYDDIECHVFAERLETKEESDNRLKDDIRRLSDKKKADFVQYMMLKNQFENGEELIDRKYIESEWEKCQAKGNDK